MFVHQAHSFTAHARLAITLSWVAGYTNVLTLLTCGQATSHVSGTVSQLGLDAGAGIWGPAAYLAALLGVFVAGAALSGFLTELARQRRWASIYVRPMMVEALVLAAFALLVDWRMLGDFGGETARLWLTLLPAFAMGLQNATVTRISGGVVRTTHVTGVVTDLGMEAAIWWTDRLSRPRGTKAPATSPGAFATGWRVLLLASIVGSFALGAALGALALRTFPPLSMVPPVLFLSWIVVLDLLRPIASTRSDEEIGGTLHTSLPPEVTVHHIAGRRGRFGRRLRLPDLTAWEDRLHARVRIVVLDIAGIEDLDEDGTTELRVAARRLKAHGRQVVFAGVTAPRYRALLAAGVVDDADAANLCSDLELAAAHAMTLLEEGAAAR
jgi:uncharacterized membrane protein YoaK (UPF0700 family)